MVSQIQIESRETLSNLAFVGWQNYLLQPSNASHMGFDSYLDVMGLGAVPDGGSNLSLSADVDNRIDTLFGLGGAN